MTEPMPWIVVLPLAGAVLALLLTRRAARAICLVAAVATLTAVVALARTVWTEGAQRYAIGGWSAPLGIELHADGAAVAMLLMSGVISLLICVYAIGYYARPPATFEWSPAESFWPLLLFLCGALNALFLAADIFNVYVALELMTLAAVAQVGLAEDRSALPAATTYLIAAFVGSMMYLLGVAILYGSYNVLDIAQLEEVVARTPASRAALVLVTIGIGLKSALFPFHFWLPRAHSIAPAPVSAALSALVVTGAYYVLLRLWSGVFAEVVTYPMAQVVGLMGSAAIVWGSVLAIQQQRLKLIVAYSTIAQVGYLFLVLPLLFEPATGVAAGGSLAPGQAWGGGLYFAISHAFAKAAMFLAAGNIVYALGDDRIFGIGGIASQLPLSTYAFGVAGISLIGIPPSGGFVAKWLLLAAAIGGGQWWWGVVILGGGLLTAGYVFQVLTQELSRARSDARPSFTPVPRVMEYAAMTLAVIALVMGLRAFEPLLFLDIGSPFPPALAPGLAP